MVQIATKARAVASRDAVTVTATEAKTRFGPLLETAMGGRTVVITRHNAPKAVLLSMAEYEALRGGQVPDLSDLEAEFDALLDSMQTPASRKARRAAFAASAEELGAAALAGARRRA